MTADRIKHLEFIQSAISRMAANSALLKGWSVTVATALFALAAKDANPQLAGLAIAPALAFWMLDAFYLRLECLFRELYDEVRLLPEPEYEEKVGAFSMRVKPYEGRVDSTFSLMWSPSSFLLHGIICLSTFCVVLFVFWLRSK